MRPPRADTAPGAPSQGTAGVCRFPGNSGRPRHSPQCTPRDRPKMTLHCTAPLAPLNCTPRPAPTHTCEPTDASAHRPCRAPRSRRSHLSTAAGERAVAASCGIPPPRVAIRAFDREASARGSRDVTAGRSGRRAGRAS
ncbi:hypothetical protein EVAR_90809_1 [Eumeta japonica]|uniref:Uncharacterized protein n=1 Tax=Eumeta variegata TaxID=151549 RepID=A0A4C2A540_EUMVA|nr:hypothetical protein EVAR_90809_1 [Eumeta japonica]